MSKPMAKIRCAVYTRKSTEEGLEQDFNSLDAQREAAEAYIASQKHAGWACLEDRYDDGGERDSHLFRRLLGLSRPTHPQRPQTPAQRRLELRDLGVTAHRTASPNPSPATPAARQPCRSAAGGTEMTLCGATPAPRRFREISLPRLR